jgi:hypothetical protein
MLFAPLDLSQVGIVTALRHWFLQVLTRIPGKGAGCTAMGPEAEWVFTTSCLR